MLYQRQRWFTFLTRADSHAIGGELAGLVRRFSAAIAPASLTLKLVGDGSRFRKLKQGELEQFCQDLARGVERGEGSSFALRLKDGAADVSFGDHQLSLITMASEDLRFAMNSLELFVPMGFRFGPGRADLDFLVDVAGRLRAACAWSNHCLAPNLLAIERRADAHAISRAAWEDETAEVAELFGFMESAVSQAQGVFWAQLLGAPHLDGLGGVERVLREAPCPVRERAGDGVLLALDADVPERPADLAAAYARLGRYLAPILERTDRFQFHSIDDAPSGLRWRDRWVAER